MPRNRDEVEFQLKIQHYAESLGYWVMRIPDSRLVKAGWPDLTILGGWKVLYREVKLDGTYNSRAQRDVGRMLWRANQDWDCWRPVNWESGKIQKELAEARSVYQAA